jgi:ferredoxin--NADP+ reductase
VLLLPEDTSQVVIMVATGTGIAPFRTFWRRQFIENVPGYKFTGLAWLFMGVANSDAKLYDDELQAIAATYPDQFRIDYALSREQNVRCGECEGRQRLGMVWAEVSAQCSVEDVGWDT